MWMTRTCGRLLQWLLPMTVPTWASLLLASSLLTTGCASLTPLPEEPQRMHRRREFREDVTRVALEGGREPLRRQSLVARRSQGG